MRLVLSLLSAVALTSACYAGGTDVNASGRGRPQVSIEFPARSEPGSTQTAVLEVFNPGPEPIGVLSVSFSLVGVGGRELPQPIVSIGAEGDNPAVVGVRPPPVETARGGVVYHFGALDEGDSATIEFDLRVPKELGVAANAVVASDGQQPERARGVLLKTTVAE
jgi:hypothetical protein